MATLTITIPCATDPFPNLFCLVYGESDCGTLCAAFTASACDFCS